MENLIKIGSLVYERELSNPLTGWVRVKNQNATSFWLPDELLAECKRIHITAVKGGENRLENLRTQNEQLRLKNDSQRKSITYYKNERDSYKEILNKECAKHQVSKDWLTKEIADQIAEKDAISGEFQDLENQFLTLKRKHQFMTTCCTVIIATLVLILILVR